MQSIVPSRRPARQAAASSGVRRGGLTFALVSYPPEADSPSARARPTEASAGAPRRAARGGRPPPPSPGGRGGAGRAGGGGPPPPPRPPRPPPIRRAPRNGR